MRISFSINFLDFIKRNNFNRFDDAIGKVIVQMNMVEDKEMWLEEKNRKFLEYLTVSRIEILHLKEIFSRTFIPNANKLVAENRKSWQSSLYKKMELLT